MTYILVNKKQDISSLNCSYFLILLWILFDIFNKDFLNYMITEFSVFAFNGQYNAKKKYFLHPGLKNQSLIIPNIHILNIFYLKITKQTPRNLAPTHLQSRTI